MSISHFLKSTGQSSKAATSLSEALEEVGETFDFFAQYPREVRDSLQNFFQHCVYILYALTLYAKKFVETINILLGYWKHILYA